MALDVFETADLVDPLLECVFRHIADGFHVDNNLNFARWAAEDIGGAVVVNTGVNEVHAKYSQSPRARLSCVDEA